MEQAHGNKQQEQKKSELKRLQKEVNRRRDLAQQANTKRSKKRINKKDHDAKSKIDLARVSGKDGVAGKLLRQMDGRLNQAKEQAHATHASKERAMGIWMPGAYSNRNSLLTIPASTLPLGQQKKLNHPELIIKPKDRIALSGINGSGKSTLIRHMLKQLNLPPDRVLYIPQEVEQKKARSILADIKKLPSDKLGKLMTTVSCLGSRPRRMLDSHEPTPGEFRKLLLAIGVTNEPHLIVMDEPTNHMDLPSIEQLEYALAACPCALLLVSHDQIFLNKLTTIKWKIDVDHREWSCNLEIE